MTTNAIPAAQAANVPDLKCYSTHPAILADVYQHTNGKQYVNVKRSSNVWAYIGQTQEDGTIGLFCINPKTGKGWQAAKYLNPADLTHVGTVVV